MRAKIANLNHCAVLFLSRAAANLCWYYYTIYLWFKSVLRKTQQHASKEEFYELLVNCCEECSLKIFFVYTYYLVCIVCGLWSAVAYLNNNINTGTSMLLNAIISKLKSN